MGRKKGGIDWEDVELEYLNSRMSLKELAEKRQISYSAVQRRAKAGQWADRRAKMEQEQSYARLGQVTDKLLMKMAETIDGEKDLEARDLKALSSALKELGEVKERLEEGGSDYVIRPCSVDEVVRSAGRRFAGEFIDRRIRLDYEPVQWETVTDGKWLTFVVEQLLSNALKYTGQEGAIRIYRQGDELCIADTGMGIAPEDLPRVFQMGYTGQNGRLDRRSSGIGLYLCRRICGNLRHGIRMESVPGKGTTVYLTLGRGDFLPE